MASDPLRLFDSFCEALAKKDLNKMMSLFSEDAAYELYSSPYTPVVGKNVLKPFMENEFRKMNEYKVKKLYTCEKKDSVVVEWVVNFKDPKTGKRNEIQGITILETRDGKIQNWREYFK